MGRKTWVISVECFKLTDQLKNSRLTLKVDETTDVVKDAHFIFMFGMCWKIL